MKAPKTIGAVRDIDFLLTGEHKPEETVDLSAATFIKPVGVVAILATIGYRVKRHGLQKVAFTLPNDARVCSYLRLAGVFDAMRDLGSFNDPQPEDVIPKQVPLRPMVPCTRFSDEREIDDLADQMEERFTTSLTGYGSLLATCHTAFSELATNVVNHADSAGGYVLAQQYEYRSGPMVEIAVADCGIGIQKSLQKNHKYTGMLPSDTDAIELSIGEGVSSLVDNSRGYGLHHVAAEVKRENARTITIRSGLGTLELHGDGTIKKTVDQTFYPGTIVSFIIPCS